MDKRISVRRQGRGWGIYRGNVLIEGGFFSKQNAEIVADEYRREQEAES